MVDYPQDGDKFYIDKAVNTISNYGSIVALTLGKYGEDVDFTGVVGEDDAAKKIRETFNKYQVKTQYVETCFTEKSSVSYKIYNSKTNKYTTISEIGSKTGLTKYKYEFVPDAIIMDDGDYNANMAALNNFPDALSIYISDKFTKVSSAYLNKCNYSIVPLSYAKDLTGVNSDLNKSENLVLIFQKFIDLYSTNLIIKLDNFDFLYCVDDEVRLIKNINQNIANKECIYYAILSYFILKKYSVEESIKLTNKVMMESSVQLDMINCIPDYKVIEKAIKEYEEFKNNNIEQLETTHLTTNQTATDTLNNQQNAAEGTSTAALQGNNVSVNGQTVQVSHQPDINPVQLHNPNVNQNINAGQVAQPVQSNQQLSQNGVPIQPNANNNQVIQQVQNSQQTLQSNVLVQQNINNNLNGVNNG